MKIQALNTYNFYVKNLAFKGKTKNVSKDAQIFNKKQILKERIKEEQRTLSQKISEIEKDSQILCNIADVYYIKAKENYISAIELYPEVKDLPRLKTKQEWLTAAKPLEVREEFDKNNQLKRRIIFEGGVPALIFVINPNKTQDCFDYRALPSVKIMELERRNGSTSSYHNVIISKNIQKDEKNKTDFVFEFLNGELLEISKDIERNDCEINKNETYLFDYDSKGERKLSCFANGVKRTFVEEECDLDDETSNTLEKLYRFEGLSSIFKNAKFSGNNIKNPHSEKEFFIFEGDEIIYARKHFADGFSETWEKINNYPL